MGAILVVSQPIVGERWRYRHGSGHVVVIREVTDITVRFSHADNPLSVFGRSLSAWHQFFEPVPIEN